MALFLALTGSALAAKAAIGSRQIVNGSVRTVDLRDSAVSSPKIAAADLGPDSVGSSELQAGSVHGSELGPIIQVSNSAPIAAGASGSVSVQCPAGTTVISGGAQPANFGVEMTSSLRSGNGWLYQAKNNNAAPSTLTVFAYCLS